MNAEELSSDFGERVIFALRALYSRHGYSRYKMSKFEEYDLYANNKDFLISDSVITFTDTDGKLMALKPDVTLSIVKNSRIDPSCVQKLYYNENVYRVSKGSRSFKEIMQVGLEALGAIDDYQICEVLTLAAESLKSISNESILDISHLGLLSDFADSIGVPETHKGEVLRCVGEKNAHELERICRRVGIAQENIDRFKRLVALGGTPQEVLPEVRELLFGRTDPIKFERFFRILSALSGSEIKDMLHVDFSVVDDIHYYNGFIFKGFISGLPNSVLSGGQYDRLMKKMGRDAGAIGFAVYTDGLEQLEPSKRPYDMDALLLYDETTPLPALQNAVKSLLCSGSVSVQRDVPPALKYRRLFKINNGKVEPLENHA